MWLLLYLIKPRMTERCWWF